MRTEIQESAGQLQPRDIEEYDSAAVWCAKHGHTGEYGSALPSNLSASVFGAINYDTEAFAERVRASAYALAMSKQP